MKLGTYCRHGWDLGEGLADAGPGAIREENGLEYDWTAVHPSLQEVYRAGPKSLND